MTDTSHKALNAENILIILTVVSLPFISGCCTPSKVNYQQDLMTSQGQCYISLYTWKELDRTNIYQAKQISSLPLFMGLADAQTYPAHGYVSLTPKQKNEWAKIAKMTFEEVRRDPNEWIPETGLFQSAMRSIRHFLTNPKDIQEFDTLSNQMAQLNRKNLEAAKRWEAAHPLKHP